MLIPVYKVGETVRIKDYDEIYKSYAQSGEIKIFPSWVSDMKQYCGREVEITDAVYEEHADAVFYRFGRAGGGWAWAECLLEKIYIDEPIEISMSLDELI